MAACPACAQTIEERARNHGVLHSCELARKARFRLAAGKKKRKKAGRPKSTARAAKKTLTEQLRTALVSTFDEIGGADALAEWAREHPKEFFAMYSRAVPRESEAVSKAQGVQIIVRAAEDDA